MATSPSLHQEESTRTNRSSNTCIVPVTSKPVVSPDSARPFFIITLTLPKPKKLRIRIPKVFVKTMHKGGAQSQQGNELAISGQCGNEKGRFDSGKFRPPKGGLIMAGFFRKKKLPQDECSATNNRILSSDGVHPNRPSSALLIPHSKFAVHGIGRRITSKARLFRRITWNKLPKKPVFRHPTLFRKHPGVSLLKSKVKKNECTDMIVADRSVERIRRILQGKQRQDTRARKSVSQSEMGVNDRNDGKLELSQLKMGVNDRNDSELELCKKRILIGYKCRPLGRSGTLRYDKNGILLPELFP